MKKYFLSVIFVLAAAGIYAQVDSLILSNGNYIVGELKSMDRGVLTIETDYSDDDFKIEWEGITEIYTSS